MKTVLLVYSGGLDTSVCIPLMKEEYGFDRVITVTVDVGQPEQDIEQAADRACTLGADHFTIDAKSEFVENHCWPAVKANGDYQGYPISTAIARPLIALKAVSVAKKFGVEAYAHGCTGKGNDQFRIEYVMRALTPEIPILAPMREGRLLANGAREPWTRSEEIDYAEAHGLNLAQTKKNIYSIDENLWGRSVEGGKLEDPSYAPPEEIFLWTASLAKTPEPQDITIGFQNGVPASIDGNKLSPLELVQAMNALAGKHGVGRVDIMEDRMLGLKVRENYECPAAVVLIAAHKALEGLVCTQAERKFKANVDAEWAELAYKGLWFDPFKNDLEAFINQVQGRVTGSVTMRLAKGNCFVIGRESPWALYNEDLASFDSKTFDQSESTGIVKAHGLQSRMYWALEASLK